MPDTTTDKTKTDADTAKLADAAAKDSQAQMDAAPTLPADVTPSLYIGEGLDQKEVKPDTKLSVAVTRLGETLKEGDTATRKEFEENGIDVAGHLRVGSLKLAEDKADQPAFAK